MEAQNNSYMFNDGPPAGYYTEDEMLKHYAEVKKESRIKAEVDAKVLSSFKENKTLDQILEFVYGNDWRQHLDSDILVAIKQRQKQQEIRNILLKKRNEM